MNVKTTTLFVIIASYLLIFGQFANAQDDDLSSNLEVYKITTKQDGDEVAERVTTTSPGDTLEYRLTYLNNTSGAISNLKPMLPIPAGLQYLSQTAQPQLDAASLDSSGNAFETLPIKREKKLENGEMAMETVAVAEFKRLRWNISSLAAQESVSVAARVWVVKNNPESSL